MFGTKGIETTEKTSVSRYLNYGINKAKINTIDVEKSNSSDARRITFHLEGEPVTESGFTPAEGAKGRVCKMKTIYLKSDEAYKDFMRQIGVIADKLGVRSGVDSVTSSTIEDYIAQVSNYITGKYLWWNIGAIEYDDKKHSYKLIKYGFVKSLAEVDEKSLKYDNGIAVEARNSAGTVVLNFNKNSKFHYEPFVKPDAGFALPGASVTVENAALSTTPTLPTPDELPFGKPNDIDDLPFGS